MLIASASHDLTASLTRVSLAPDASPSSQTLASLHLHTSPLSSISSDHTGSHLLTASWDHLVGFWDTAIPAHDEVATSDPGSSSDRKKRRKIGNEVDQGRAKRKAPTTVLKSHTARVSKAAFCPGSNKRAYSCGFDSTVRTWDVESGVCTDTIVRPPLSSWFYRPERVYTRPLLNDRCSIWSSHRMDILSSLLLPIGLSRYLICVRPHLRVRPGRSCTPLHRPVWSIPASLRRRSPSMPTRPQYPPRAHRKS